MLGLERGEIRIVPYTESWKKLFAEEQEELERIIGKHVISIEHVGSTSVPGLAAKPILDIAIAVDNFEEARVTIDPIVGLGYVYRGENGIPRRHYFVKGDPSTHHIHTNEITSLDWENLVLFRDYLRAHPTASAEYLALKQSLVGVSENRQEYQDGKAAFIQQTLEKARLQRNEEPIR